MSDLPDPVPAATVVVVRDGEAGMEILLLRRSGVGAFPNFWVFPGGRVDLDDLGDDEMAKAAAAARREALEEVGLMLDPIKMHAFSHWTPPPIQPRRFATWFFVAQWQDDDVVIDGTEIVEHRWLTPRAALEAGLLMAPPTVVTLHELEDAGSFAMSQREPPHPRYMTRPYTAADGRQVLLWHPDAGYETGDLDAQGPRNRLWYSSPQQWMYERA
jgi:8-oxo-dGTP pyrophosphatase MutT (NUDIX family)